MAGEVLTLSGQAPSSHQAGDTATLVVRPEHVVLSRRTDSGLAGWGGVIETRQFLGESVEYVVRLTDGSTHLQVRTDASAEFGPGDPVRVDLKTEHCRVLADAEGR